MRFSLLLAAASATIVAAQVDLGDVQNCSDPQGLSNCAAPYLKDVQNCGNTDISCLCKAATGGQACFTKYCPEVTFPYSAELQAECGGSGSGSGSGTGSSSGDTSSGSASETGSGSASSTGSGGSASSTDAPTNGDSNSNTNTAPKSGGGDPGAGASIFAPAGSLLAAIVAIAAMFLRPGRRLLHVLIDKAAPGRVGTYVIDSLWVSVGGELEKDDVDDSHSY
ncbi:hypothetical protein V499_08573 [Pseudogymnoascus sp. VKM F-103]|nr:hypothetical protein V499_08573 [Pseudogymnoascus sp. VKM F-103]